jgi:hypothetical protein
MVYGTGGKIFSRRDKNSALNTIWNSVRESSGYNDQSDMERNAERFFGVKNPQGNLDQINKEKFNAVMEHLNKHYPNLAKEFYSEEPIYAAGADGTSFKTDRSRFKINTGNYIIHGISGYKNDEGETTRLAQTWTEVPNRTVSINPYTGDEEPYVNDLFKYILKRAHGVDLDNPIKKKITDSNRDSLTCQSRAVDHGGGSVSYEARRPGLLPELEFPPSDRSRLTDKEKAMAHEQICTDHVHHDFDSDGNITAVYTKPEIHSDHIKPLRRLVREGIRKINPDLFDINPRAAYDYAASSYRRFLDGEIELNGEVTEKGKRKRPGSATSGVVFSPGKAKRTDGPSTKKQDRGGPKQNRPRKK